METETKEGEAASAGNKRPFSDVDDKEAPDDEATAAAVPPPKSKKTKKKHMDPNILRVRGMIQHCCATDDLMTAIKTYDKAIVDGTRIEAQSFYNLLNLCDGLQHRGIHIGTPKPSDEKSTVSPTEPQKEDASVEEVDLETRQKHAFRVKKRMDELKMPLTETAYTALVKVLCKSKQVDEVEKILDEAETVQQCLPKLRLYTPLLVAYSEMGQMLPALNVWLRLSKQTQSKEELFLTEVEYIALIRCATKVGNAIVMERVLSYLSEDVLVPSRETSRAIMDWFESSCAIESGDPSSSATSPEILAVLEKIAPHVEHITSMGPVQCKITEEWTVSEDCQVDAATGIFPTGCLEGKSLQPVVVSPLGWAEMKQMNEKIVISGQLDNNASQYQGGRKGPKRALGKDNLEERKKHWKAFNDYLERQEKPLDIVIDGANIGYYEQNFAGAPKHVDYRQIDWVVQHCLRLNKTVLLFLHSRHFSNKLMPRNAEPIVRAWREAGILYSTPPGMNDDWFWMHAALQSGPGTHVLTNDEMRDHHFQMLAPRSFVRWKDRHQIHFGFGNWEKDAEGKSLRRRQVDLVYPEIYSRRMQRVQDGLVVPRPKRGDENRFLDGTHTATDDEPMEERYVCIRPKSRLEKLYVY
jgi:ribonuclease P protein 3